MVDDSQEIEIGIELERFWEVDIMPICRFSDREGYMFRIAIAVAAASMLAGAAHSGEVPAGVWTGTGFQTMSSGKISTWTINLTIGAQGSATAIDYPTLNCGGTLSYLRTVGDVREYRETLSYGAERCTNNGTVGVRQKLGKLIWYWSGEGTVNPTGIDVAVLARRG